MLTKMMAKKRDTYIAGQTLQNKVEIDEFGNRTVTQKVIYEQREFVEGYTDVRLPIKHKFQNGGFITVFQEALQTIVQYGNLSKSEMALLLWLLGTAGIDGSIITDLDEMSGALGIGKPMASKALKGLVERNIVLRRDRSRYERTPLRMDLTFNYDQLNYNIAYNGKTANFKRKRFEHPALSVPGGQEGEWIDTVTGQATIEKNGQIVQECLPIGFDQDEVEASEQ